MSFIRPLRVWWSPLWTLRCSVRCAMRSVRSAIWTSGDPVSDSCNRCSAMTTCLSGMYEQTSELGNGRGGAAAALEVTTQDGPSAPGEDPARGHHVGAHLGREVLHPLEAPLVPEALDEGHTHPLAVQVAVEVDQVGLDQRRRCRPSGAGEGRPQPDRDGGGHEDAVGPAAPP